MAFSVSDISGYIQANEAQLIGKAVVGSKTAGLLNLQVGVVGTANLNLLTATAGLQDGSACGFNAQGDVTISKRQIVAKPIKSNQTFCDKDLIGTSLQWGVRMAAGQTTIPFEEMFVGQIVKEINKEVENIIWQGNTVVTGGTYLDLADGFITILDSASGSTIDGSVSGKTLADNPYDVILNMVAKLPDATIDMNNVIFVGYDVYRKFVAELQAKNLFHYTTDLTAAMETVIPGTNIRLIGVPGLTGTGKGYASYLENFYLGTDLLGDKETVDFWFSKDDDIYKMKVSFSLGVQVAFPDLVVVAA